MQRPELVGFTAQILMAFVENNALSAADIPMLIANIHGVLRELSLDACTNPPAALVPPVSVKKSLTPEYIICLEDGRKFISLKRHLNAKYSMTPDEYRARWGLPIDYPMVAPNYAKARSDLAKKAGLGQVGRKSTKQSANRTH